MKPIIVMVLVMRILLTDGFGVAKIDGWSSIEACQSSVDKYSGLKKTPDGQRDFEIQAFCMEVK